MTEHGEDLALAVVRDARSYVVARKRDPRDWLVAFDDDGAFPAKDWAENMVRIFNARLLGRRTDLLPPGASPGNYHPHPGVREP
jgi:hypothetical protein